MDLRLIAIIVIKIKRETDKKKVINLTRLVHDCEVLFDITVD